MQKQTQETQDLESYKAQTQEILERREAEAQKEQKGIYNVTYNDKNATLIRQDLDTIENAILLERGRENIKTGKGYGASHCFKTYHRY